MNYDCTTDYNYYTKFFSKYCIKRTLHDTEMNWLSLFQFYRKTFFRSVDPKQQNLTFSLSSIIETLVRGCAWLFRRDTKILRGGAKRYQGRSHLPSKSGHMKNAPLLSRKWCIFHAYILY
jgi:hypothetical protein